MGKRHVALLVEDQPVVVEDTTQILDAAGCDTVVCNTKSEALDALRSRQFCVVVLDLGIFGAASAGEPHSEHGRSLLRELRRMYPEHPGTWQNCHVLPVVVSSGINWAHENTRMVMVDGADDIFPKSASNTRDLSEAIRSLLDRSGRTSHDVCSKLGKRTVSPAGDSDRITLSIPGDRDKLRVRIVLNQQPLALPIGVLIILLYLMVAHAQGVEIHRNDMGGADERGGSKAISQLRHELMPVTAIVGALIENDHRGNYRLSERVVLGEVNTEALLALGNSKISDLATRLAAARKPRRKA